MYAGLIFLDNYAYVIMGICTIFAIDPSYSSELCELICVHCSLNKISFL